MIEDQLIKKCIQCDSRSQKQLFDLLSPKLMGVARRYANSYDETQDIFQEGFIKIFEKMGTYNFQGSFEGWCRKVMVNTALGHLRKNDVLRFAEDIEVQYEYGAKEESAIDKLNASDLMSLIQKIPVGYKTVFNLYAIEGYSHQEIASMLNISEGTSKSQYARARKFIQGQVIQSEKYVTV